MTILPVTLDNTFDQWRTKTNQLIAQAEQINSNAVAGFQTANAANSFAVALSVSANAHANAVGVSANANAHAVGVASRAQANAVGVSANSYADSVGLASRVYANNVGVSANAFAAVATNLSSGTVPVARLSGSYTGITGVGTITTGRWNGSAIGVTFGGTGGTTQATARAGLGLGTASTFNVGTSGATIGRLDSENTWGALQTFLTGMYIDGAASTIRGSYLRTSGSFRWVAGTDNAAETGSNAGSNYAIYRYADNGTLLDMPFSISRSTGRTLIQTLNLTNDLAVSDGGTGASDAAGARTNLGLGNLSVQNSVNGSQIIVGSDTQGDILYRGATEWVRLPAGSAGQSLVTSGTGANPSWGSSIVRGTTIVIPNPGAGQYDITGIPPWARRISLMLRGVSTNNTFELVVRLGTGGVVQTSGYIATVVEYEPGVTGSALSNTTCILTLQPRQILPQELLISIT
jgi:hypothetical protein